MPNRQQTRKRPVTVCVVERNGLAAAYLNEILKRDANLEILSEDSILRSPVSTPPVMAIDAVTLPGSLHGYLTILRSRIRDARILLLSDGPSTDELRPLPFLGINGLVMYSEVKSELRPAIRAISRGDTWFAPQILAEFLRYSRTFGLPGQSATEKDLFTPRERLIVGLVERRLGNKEIAAALKITESTVKFHLSNVYRKLGVRDRGSAATLAASPGLVRMPLVDALSFPQKLT